MTTRMIVTMDLISMINTDAELLEQRAADIIDEMDKLRQETSDRLDAMEIEASHHQLTANQLRRASTFLRAACT